MGETDQEGLQYGELSRDDAFVRLCTLRRKISVDSVLQVARINWELDEDISSLMVQIFQNFDKINKEYNLKEKKLKKRLLSDLMVKKLKAKIDLLEHRSRLVTVVTDEAKRRYMNAIKDEQLYPLCCLLIVQASLRLLEPSPIIRVAKIYEQDLNDRLERIRDRIARYFNIASDAIIDNHEYLPDQFGAIQVLSPNMKTWVDASIMTRFSTVIQDNLAMLTLMLTSPMLRIRIRRYSFSQVFGDFRHQTSKYPKLTTKTFRKLIEDQRKKAAAARSIMGRFSSRESRRFGSFVKRKPQSQL